MSVLVDDLLLLARLDEGRPLEHEPVDLDELVARGGRDGADASSPTGRSTSSSSRPSWSATATGCARSSTTCSATSARTRRLATPRRGDARARERHARVIEVADSGPGMTRSTLAHVFERFYRADASRARASGGVGLGSRSSRRWPRRTGGDRRGLGSGRGRDVLHRVAARALKRSSVSVAGRETRHRPVTLRPVRLPRGCGRASGASRRGSSRPPPIGSRRRHA